jgi:hypothetical protein
MTPEVAATEAVAVDVPPVPLQVTENEALALNGPLP